MLRLFLFLAALLMSAPILAQEPEWRQSSEYDVLLAPYEYQPRRIELEAGRPVRLRFVNSGQATLSFNAPGFFRSSQMRSGDADAVQGGGIRLAPGERRTIVLVPARGRYKVRSGNFFHRLLGMTGEIVVQ